VFLAVAGCATSWPTVAPKVSFLSNLKLVPSSVLSEADGTFDRGFGLRGGGVSVIARFGEVSSVGSGGRRKARCGLGDRTGGGAFCRNIMGETGRVCDVEEPTCSNMLTSEVVGAIGVSSVGLDSPIGVRLG
jgi:hypothetical protein